MMKKRIISLICIFSIVLGMTSEYVWATETESIVETESYAETVEEQQSEELTETFDIYEQESETVIESERIEIEVDEMEIENETSLMKEEEMLETLDMHRLYNPNSGEHFYTSTVAERDHLVSVGWN